MRRLRIYLFLFVPLFLVTFLLWLFPFGQSQGQDYLVILVILALTLMAGFIIHRSGLIKLDARSSSALHGHNKILQASLDAIITADEQGKVIAFNPAAETIFGYSSEEAKNQCLTELIHSRTA